jgi:L-amino acid N-acyltransferase YncA
MEFRVDDMKAEDWSGVSDIYRDGIATGNATFETSVPEWQVWDAEHMPDPRLVARSIDHLVGWAALARISHQLSAPAPDTSAITALRLVGLLTVL